MKDRVQEAQVYKKIVIEIIFVTDGKESENPRVIVKQVRGSETNGPLSKRKRGLWVGDYFFPEGQRLRKIYKGKPVEVVIGNGCVRLGRRKYPNLSIAAQAASGTNVNAWFWWRYFDEETQRWELIDRRRHLGAKRVI